MFPFTTNFDEKHCVLECARDNSIRMKGLPDINIINLTSQFFYDTDNSKDYFYFLTIDGKYHYIKQIRYFEIETFGYCDLGIGLCKINNEEKFEHVGFFKESIGVNSLVDGIIIDGVVKKKTKSFGKHDEDHNFIGIGYNIDTSNVFFTVNGKYVTSEQIKWKRINACLSVRHISVIKVNYGDQPFRFDIEKYFKQTNPQKEEQTTSK